MAKKGWISVYALQDKCIDNAAMQDGAITADKIAAGAVTLEKMASAKVFSTGVYGYSEYGRCVYG